MFQHVAGPNSQAEGLEERERGGLPRLLGLSWPALRCSLEVLT